MDAHVPQRARLALLMQNRDAFECADELCSLPFKGRAGVGMVLADSSTIATPSPPNPPLEGEGL
jgi:hypothetical protein